MPADPGGRVWPSEAQERLLRAALARDGSAEAHFLSWLELVDIDGPIDEGTYRSLPLLWATLAQQRVDHPLRARLKGVFRNAWVKAAQQHALASELLRAFEANGIRTMVSKGLPLSLIHYDKPALRPMNDLDIIVPAHEAPKASRLLEDLGFAAQRRPWRVEKALRHALMHRHPKRGEIDLHWHVLFECPRQSADGHFWSAAVPIHIGDAVTLRPATTDLLLHVLVHGIRWNLSPPMRWVPDAMMILRSDEPIDWDRLVGFAAEHRVACRVAFALDYLRTRFGAPVPPEAAAALHRARSIVERLEVLAMRGGDAHSPWRHLRRSTYVMRLLRSDDAAGLPRALVGELADRLRRDRPAAIAKPKAAAPSRYHA